MTAILTLIAVNLSQARNTYWRKATTSKSCTLQMTALCPE
jgi:hypothetical protein